MSVYAIIQSGGKQYRVKEGQALKLEKLGVEVGKQVDFDQILMLVNGDDVHIGNPYVKDAKVMAEVLSEGRADKIHVIKFKRRKHHMKQTGHRQDYTEVKITGLMLGNTKLEAPKLAAPSKAAKKAKPAKPKKNAQKAKAKSAKKAAAAPQKKTQAAKKQRRNN